MYPVWNFQAPVSHSQFSPEKMEVNDLNSLNLWKMIQSSPLHCYAFCGLLSDFIFSKQVWNSSRFHVWRISIITCFNTHKGLKIRFLFVIAWTWSAFHFNTPGIFKNSKQVTLSSRSPFSSCCAWHPLVKHSRKISSIWLLNNRLSSFQKNNANWHHELGILGTLRHFPIANPTHIYSESAKSNSSSLNCWQWQEWHIHSSTPRQFTIRQKKSGKRCCSQNTHIISW